MEAENERGQIYSFSLSYMKMDLLIFLVCCSDISVKVIEGMPRMQLLTCCLQVQSCACERGLHPDAREKKKVM